MAKGTKIKSQKIKLSASEITNVIDKMYNQNCHIQSLGLKPKALNIIGVHGIGKSTVVEDYCKNKGIQYVYVKFASMEETGDILGLPFHSYYMCGEVLEDVTSVLNGKKITIKKKVNKCTWVPELAKDTYLAMGYHLTGDVRMDNALPTFIQKIDPTKGGIMIIDDWSRCPSAFAQLAMDIFLEQKTQTWSLPKGWTVIATANPSESEDGLSYDVTDMDPAQQDRYFTFEMMFNVKDWAVYADNHHIQDEHIQFILDNPNVINAENSPRAVTSFFEEIIGLDYNTNSDFITKIGEARLGMEFMSAFTTAMHNKKCKIPRAEFIMNEPDYKKVLKAMKDVIGDVQQNTYRADISWLIMTRLKTYCAELKATPQQLDRLKSIVVDRIINDNQVYQLVKSIVLPNNSFIELATNDEFMALLGK